MLTGVTSIALKDGMEVAIKRLTMRIELLNEVTVRFGPTAPTDGRFVELMAMP